MPPKWKQRLHTTWRRTSGAAPDAVKAARPVLNGGREETCRKVTRLAPTQRRGGGDQTGHVCLNRTTSWSPRTALTFPESARRAFCSARCSLPCITRCGKRRAVRDGARKDTGGSKATTRLAACGVQKFVAPHK